MASTEPDPWPWSINGTPACVHAQEAKYAHHGPGPGAPAVAERYSPIRGESFEPGGCSASPTSEAAAARIAEPPPAPAGATGASGLAVPIAPGPIALVNMLEND